VPLIITQRVAQKIRKDFEQDAQVNPDNSTPDEEVPDTQLSGKYWVKGAKYEFDGKTKEFSTELILARREWIASKKITTPHV
jgi:flavodoxin